MILYIEFVVWLRAAELVQNSNGAQVDHKAAATNRSKS